MFHRAKLHPSWALVLATSSGSFQMRRCLGVIVFCELRMTVRSCLLASTPSANLMSDGSEPHCMMMSDSPMPFHIFTAHISANTTPAPFDSTTLEMPYPKDSCTCSEPSVRLLPRYPSRSGSRTERLAVRYPPQRFRFVCVVIIVLCPWRMKYVMTGKECTWAHVSLAPIRKAQSPIQPFRFRPRWAAPPHQLSFVDSCRDPSSRTHPIWWSISWHAWVSIL